MLMSTVHAPLSLMPLISLQLLYLNIMYVHFYMFFFSQLLLDVSSFLCHSSCSCLQSVPFFPKHIKPITQYLFSPLISKCFSYGYVHYIPLKKCNLSMFMSPHSFLKVSHFYGYVSTLKLSKGHISTNSILLISHIFHISHHNLQQLLIYFPQCLPKPVFLKLV